MNDKAHKPAPPHHSNVFCGETLRGLLGRGWQRGSDIHYFNMRWACGHTGSAVSLDGPQGFAKACETCMDEMGA